MKNEAKGMGIAMEIQNPILRGFHPDPSIVRAGEDYYIANSTFEWWPGIRLHHSKDLKHWELIEYPLNRTSQLDYVGDRVYLEGPHILKRNGFYYLFCADTGTGEGHGQSILRSEKIWGPYEWNKENSILTARDAPDCLLQKSGHCDLVDTPEGEWYAVHLCGRALDNRNPKDAKRFPGERRYTLTAENKVYGYPVGFLAVEEGKPVFLKVKVDHDKLQFYYGVGREPEKKIARYLTQAFCLMKPARKAGLPGRWWGSAARI